MGVLKNDVGRPSNKTRLLRKLLVILIIIVFILLVVGIYLYVNRFPYRGYKYEDDNWDVMTFSKSGKFSSVAVDAGNDFGGAHGYSSPFFPASRTMAWAKILAFW